MLGLLHPLDRGLDGVDPRLDPPRGHHLPRRLGLGRQPLAAALLEGAALEGRLRLRPGLASCAAPTRPPARSSRAARRGARRRWSCSTSTTRTSRSSSGARPRRSARRASSSGRLRHVARLARLGLDPVPEREQLGPRHGRLHGGRRRGQGVEPHRAHRRLGRRDDRRARAAARRSPRRPGSAPTRASSTTRRSTRGTRCPNTGRINASNPCSEYMSHRRLGVQPRLAQPDEVPPRGRRVRRRGVRARGRRRLPRAGDPRRLLVATRRPRSSATRRPSASSGSATRTSARC